MKNIIVLWEINVNLLNKYFKNINITFIKTENEIKKLYWKYDYLFLRGANYLINQDINKDLISIWVKKILVFWIWIDNIEFCKDIQIINAPISSVQSVTELTLMLLLIGLRNWIQLNNLLKGWIYRRKMWYNLEELSIWILWYWNIWKNTVKVLSWFNNKISVFDHNLEKQYSKFKIPRVNYCNNLEKFKKSIDVLIIHINLKKDNINLINDEFLKNSKIKFIINTSRKWIVKEEDILKLLNKNKLQYYWTDVIDWEPNIEKINPKLIFNENVIVLPHIWANTFKSQKNIFKYLSNKIKNEI